MSLARNIFVFAGFAWAFSTALAANPEAGSAPPSGTTPALTSASTPANSQNSGPTFSSRANPIPAPLPTAKPAVSAKKTSPKTAVEPTSCHGKALKQKDCHMKIGGTQIRLWHDKIFMASALGRYTATIPEQSDLVEWSQLLTRKIGKIEVIEFTFWSPPDPATGIESLNWFVYAIEDGRAELKFHKPVQKRVKTTAGHWRNDQMIGHDLFFRGSKFMAKYGHESQEL